ncbi:MAG: radical SAM protein [Nanobdellota archaeon]
MNKQNFKFNDWDVSLPSIAAFTFSQTELSNWFNSENNFPLVLDTNILSGCNVNCVYCSTEGGKSDVRWDFGSSKQYISDSDLKELSSQFSTLGGKTIFLCSNGEPLLNKRRFLDLATHAKSVGLNVITYTNGSTLSPDFIKELNVLDVNLVMKWESLDPFNNDLIILNSLDKRKNSFSVFGYELFNGVRVPTQILSALDLYSSKSNLAIETMITKLNMDDILPMRKFIYDSLDVSQFLKQTYNIGYANSNLEVQVSDSELDLINSKVISFDESRGLKYPNFDTPDNYSYDSRRLMNNLVNRSGFPFRTFLHEVGGVYHSSQIVKKRFGYSTDNVIPLKVDGVVDFNSQIKNISEVLK